MSSRAIVLLLRSDRTVQQQHALFDAVALAALLKALTKACSGMSSPKTASRPPSSGSSKNLKRTRFSRPTSYVVVPYDMIMS